MKKQLDFLKLVRPHHYIKNGFIWVPILFGYKINNFHSVCQTFWTFIAFCFLSSTVYIINDLKDIQSDRQHPTKKLRPLASGAVGTFEAIVFLLCFFILFSIVSYIFLKAYVLFILFAYLFLNVIYSIGLKHVALVDVVCIAVGFDLRVFAGGIAADVHVSHWLVLMVFLLALFLALSKRRDELHLVSKGHNPRQNLNSYNLEFVNHAVVALVGVIIVSYILYTVSPETIEKHGSNNLYLTTFWVIIGILRYLQLTFVYHKGGSPTTLILKDLPLQVTIILWLFHFYLLLYVFRF